jgi:hypothetical protein
MSLLSAHTECTVQVPSFASGIVDSSAVLRTLPFSVSSASLW